MCGIFGLLTPGIPLDLDACAQATEALAHRGPDGRGYAFGSSTRPECVTRTATLTSASLQAHTRSKPDWFLGHRRLAILDLSEAASQPMCSEDGRSWIVFNGEIYNHRELRDNLAARGRRFFCDHSDTEALLRGYEEWGYDVVDHLKGMFAFAIVNLSTKVVFLARDCFGEKPLYFAGNSRGLAFASEPRALIASGFASNDISASAVSDYLTFGYVPAPRTIFADMGKLRAAETMTFRLERLNRPTAHRYWELQYRQESPADPCAWQEEFDSLLTDAVRTRLESDVPLGAFLSGGLDSTSVVQKMTLAGIQPRTFTIAFAEAAHDESEFARAVADRFRTAHHFQTVGPGHLLDALQTIPQVFDEPFGDASAIPMLALARMARQYVTVALSGDGGDELLAGYTRYRLNTAIGRVFDGSLGRLAGACGAVLNKSWPDDVRGRGFVKLLAPGGGTRYRRLVSDNWLAKQATVGRSDLTAFTSAWDDGTPGLTNRMCKADVQLYLPEDLMTKVDRSCMAVGLEPRAPFLDRALFEFVARAPAGVKGRGRHTKQPLRRLLDQSLGPRFASRHKQGFSVPLRDWFRNELRDMVHDTLGGSTTFVGQLFPPGLCRNLLRAHSTGTRDMSARLWQLLALQLWHARFGGSITSGTAAA